MRSLPIDHPLESASLRPKSAVKKEDGPSDLGQSVDSDSDEPSGAVSSVVSLHKRSNVSGVSKTPRSPKGRKRSKGHKQEKYARGTRSYTMSHIRGKDTSIEVMVRSYLFSRGLRFRKNDKRYPGHPDVVLPKWHTMVFVNGCFWHMHEGCEKYSIPKSNVDFWTQKLTRNRDRDRRQRAQLEAVGWKVIVVWGCELNKSNRQARLEKLYREIVGD
jgi:DNA mismatch endonuclease, patch repair protein